MASTMPPLGKTLKELAALVGGTLVGDSGRVIDGAATLGEAGPKDIAFLGNAKYAEQAAASNAGALLLPLASASAPGKCKNRILVDDPQYAFSQVLGLIDALINPKTAASIAAKASVSPKAQLGAGVSVGAFAVIEAGAQIGDGTEVGPQVFIGRDAKVGKNGKLYPGVVIRERSALGERCIVHSGAVIGADGFGFSPDKKTGKHRKLPQIGNVEIGDDVEIGANVTIDRASVGSTRIGQGTKIDNLVQIAHGCQIGPHCILVSQVGIAGSTELGHHVVLGGQVGLVGHIKIGDGVQVGAQSGIMSDVPAGTIMFGYPAMPHRESMKLQVLYRRLPELFASVKALKEQLGLKEVK